MFVRMSRFFNRKSTLCIVVALTLVAAFAGSVVLRGRSASAASGPTTKSQACAQVEKTIWVSSGALMYCNGPRPNGPAVGGLRKINNFSPNVDAASPSEDVSPNGTQAYG